MGEECVTYGDKRNTYRILVGKRKSLLNKSRRRQDNIIKIVLRETGWGVDRILLVQGYEHSNVYSGPRNGGYFS
jgi:hypothetical protein